MTFQVFQQRKDGSVDFNRMWSDYEHGFGDPNTEYWIGLLSNAYHHMITTNVLFWNIYENDYVNISGKSKIKIMGKH